MMGGSCRPSSICIHTALATSEAEISRVSCMKRISARRDGCYSWTAEVCLLRSGETWMEKAIVLASGGSTRGAVTSSSQGSLRSRDRSWLPSAPGE